MALNGLLCADVPLRTYTLTHMQSIQMSKFVIFRRNFDLKQKSITKFHCLETSSGKVVAQSPTY